jgi:lysozyme
LIGTSRAHHAIVINAMARGMAMKTSAKGIKLIEQREGVRHGAYRDSRGLWTIGVGHLSDAYFRVSPGMMISEAKALELLAHDLGEVEATIARAVHVPLAQYQFDALASLGYNIGCGGLAHSSVVHFVNLRLFTQAADAFMQWCHPSVLRGRRESERRQFMGE